MNDQDWGALSDQAAAAAGVVYFLALLAHSVEWSAMRHVPVERAAGARSRERVAVGAGGPVETPPASGTASTGAGGAKSRHRLAMFGRLGLLLTILGTAVHLVSLVGRGMAADPNRVPWGNMYEFTLSGTFFVALIYLVLYRRFQLSWLGPWVLGVVFTLLMVSMIWLHEAVAPLPEALMSPWLVIHVVAAVIATGAFTLGGLVALLYLVRLRVGTRTTGYLARLPEPAMLDRVSYRMHAFGFPIWTFAVLIAGPIWAHQAWSSYWNWDPKEVWALITWVVYAAYLHARATAGWRGKGAAYIALVGLATLWFNFIGINYFSTTSQHSYAAPAVVRVVDAPAQEAAR